MAAGVVADILDRLGLRAIDTGRDDGGFFDPAEAVASLQRWREYRNRVLGPSSSGCDGNRQHPRKQLAAEQPTVGRQHDSVVAGAE